MSLTHCLLLTVAVHVENSRQEERRVQFQRQRPAGERAADVKAQEAKLRYSSNLSRHSGRRRRKSSEISCHAATFHFNNVSFLLSAVSPPLHPFVNLPYSYFLYKHTHTHTTFDFFYIFAEGETQMNQCWFLNTFFPVNNLPFDQIITLKYK